MTSYRKIKWTYELVKPALDSKGNMMLSTVSDEKESKPEDPKWNLEDVRVGKGRFIMQDESEDPASTERHLVLFLSLKK